MSFSEAKFENREKAENFIKNTLNDSKQYRLLEITGKPSSKEIPLDKNLFRLQEGTIYMGRIPLWRTCSPSLENYKFNILDETEYDFGFVTLCCIDGYGDYYHFGKWPHEEYCRNWVALHT